MKSKITKKILLMIIAFYGCVTYAQTVKGTVSDSNFPIPGVNIFVKGTSNGVISDFDGKYTLNNVAKGSVIVFSFIGYTTKEVVIEDLYEINVTLIEDTESLDEIVVIGYGTQKKSLSTSASLNIKGEDIKQLSTVSGIHALQGIAPGVSITRNNGQPGASTKVVIRGIGTIGDTSPLYVVDGIVIGSNIDYLNPSDIESIDVLKDASSAAIYGSRAANGVILVTTVKGKKGQKSRITYDTYYGIQNIYKNVDPLNAQEYMSILNEARFNDGLPEYNFEADLKNNVWLNNNFPNTLGTKYGEEIWNNLQNGWQGTNWVDAITKEDAAITSHSLSIAGAKEDATYSFGISHINQEGIIGGDIIDAGYKRLTARMNTEFVLFKNEDHDIITIGETLTYTNQESKDVATGNIYWNSLHSALVHHPLQPVYWEQSIPNNIDPQGFAPSVDGWLGGNPAATLFYNHNFANLGNKHNNIIGNFYVKIEPLKNLKIRSSYGIDTWFGHRRSYVSPVSLGQLFVNDIDNVTQSQYQGAKETWSTNISYEKTIKENHKITALVGGEKRKEIINTEVGGSKSFSNFGTDPQFAYLNNFEGGNSPNISTWGQDNSAGGGGILSWFGRLSYNFKEKYLFSGVLRADASSNFASENRWGTFPSFSAGWVISDENFMQTTSNFLDFAKIRASWGQNGNDRIPNFIYTSNISYISPGYFFGPDKILPDNTAVLDRVSNRDIKWETSEQIDIGLDARFFNSKLKLTADWYKKSTKDWLVEAPTKGTAGANAPFINGGDIENTGYEFSLAWQDNENDFKYGATVSGAFNKNRVTRIANEQGVINGPTRVLSENTSFVSRVEVGQPIGFFYGFKTDGLLQTQDDVDAYVIPDTDINGVANTNAGEPYFSDQRPGDVRFIDTNQDGEIDDDDKQYLGNPNPDFELGLQLNAEYKGFYTNVTLSGKFGMQVMRSYRSFATSPKENYTSEIFNRWHGPGTSNKIPRLSSVPGRNETFISDIYMHNSDFLRINNLTFGYKLKEALSNVGFITDAKLFVTVNNLYTFTNYEGMDPDVSYGGDGASWASGIDLGLYPQPRTVILGLSLNF